MKGENKNKSSSSKHKAGGITSNRSKVKTNLGKPTTRKLPFKNISIVGDSHARHLAGLVGELAGPGTTVTGECKPNAGLLNIAPTKSRKIPDDHCYVFLLGTNDVAAGRQETIFRHFEDTIKQCKSSSKVLICTLPKRHDLSPSSHIHYTTSLVNSFIEELCTRYEGVRSLNTNSIRRGLFTSHGMHLRMAGKRLLALRLAEALCLFTQSHATGNDADLSTPQTRQEKAKTTATIPGEKTFAEAVKTTTQQKTMLNEVQMDSIKSKTDSDQQKNLVSNCSFLGNPRLATDKI